MIYITGDTHCPTGMDKLNETNFPQQKHMTKKDYVIICGDFGDIWSAKSNEQKDMLQWLSQRNFTTLFLDGNWENYGKLNSQTITVWNGGSAHRLTDSVIHLMRGQIYTLNRRSFFVMGGACSKYKELRNKDGTWWPEEMPSTREYRAAWRNLEKACRKVDYILTHTAPYSLVTQLRDVEGEYPLNLFLQEIEEKIRYKHWYFGHFHRDIELEEKHTGVYHRLLPLR